MRLIDTAIRNARPSVRGRKLYDGDGLYLCRAPTGRRTWRFRYHLERKEKQLHRGRYPETALQMARGMRLDARRVLELGERSGDRPGSGAPGSATIR
jgi:Arm DNA-binding domain